MIREQLVFEEGRRATVYKDSRGLYTIGIGRLVDSSVKGAGLRPFEQDWLLDNDIVSHLYDLRVALPWIDTLDDVRKEALLNMAFQMGVTGLVQFTNSLYYIRLSRWKEAAANLKQSLWAKQTPARAARVIEQILTGVRYEVPPAVAP